MTHEFNPLSRSSRPSATETYVWRNPSDRVEEFSFEVRYKVTRDGRRYMLPRQSLLLNQLKKQYASYIMEIE